MYYTEFFIASAESRETELSRQLFICIEIKEREGGLRRGEPSCHIRTALSSFPGDGTSSDLDTAWVRWTAVHLKIDRVTIISVDAILLIF